MTTKVLDFSAMSLAQNVKHFRVERGMSQADLGKLVGVSQATIDKIESGRTSRTKFLFEIARALNVKAVDLDPTAADQAAPNLTPNVDFSNLIPAEDLVGEKDLPVFGSAEGGPDGSLILDNTPVEWVKRPQPLFRVPKGFATFVVGSSMEPAYYPGDRLLVHPSRPPIHNSDVVVYRDNNDGTANALVKRLVRYDNERWYLRQYNPQTNFDLPRSQWPKALAIVGKYAR